jgi:hypothetical protein
VNWYVTFDVRLQQTLTRF